jgi:hypothetical protein
MKKQNKGTSEKFRLGKVRQAIKISKIGPLSFLS